MGEYGIKLLTWGLRAFFRMKGASGLTCCSVMPPGAARGVLESFYRSPEMKWVVDAVHVLNRIEFQKSHVIPEQTILKNVRYGIEAHIEIVDNKSKNAHPAVKHLEIFKRRVKSNRPYRPPYFGFYYFGANCTLTENFPAPDSSLETELEIGEIPNDRGGYVKKKLVNGVYFMEENEKD